MIYIDLLIVHFWSARQKYLEPYRGVIARGLSQSWNWIEFRRSLENFPIDQQHTAQFKNSYFAKEFCVESIAFSSLLFGCIDNAATMIASFDGRFDVDSEVHIRRSDCVEHRSSKCIVESFSRGKTSELNHFFPIS